MPLPEGVDPEIFAGYGRSAVDSMRRVLERVDDDELNVRPFGAGTNSIAALVVHCAGTTEFWLGHVALGRPSDRDRDAEFTATAERAELERLLDRIETTVDADVRALAEPGPENPNEMRAFLQGDQGDVSVVVHALEELFQHLGHLEITVDALVARRAH